MECRKVMTAMSRKPQTVYFEIKRKDLLHTWLSVNPTFIIGLSIVVERKQDV